jgi:hypothetical protein
MFEITVSRYHAVDPYEGWNGAGGKQCKMKKWQRIPSPPGGEILSFSF